MFGWFKKERHKLVFREGPVDWDSLNAIQKDLIGALNGIRDEIVLLKKLVDVKDHEIIFVDTHINPIACDEAKRENVERLRAKGFELIHTKLHGYQEVWAKVPRIKVRSNGISKNK